MSTESPRKQTGRSLLTYVTAKGGFVMLKICHDYDEKVNTRDKLREWIEARSSANGVTVNGSDAGSSLSGSGLVLI